MLLHFMDAVKHGSPQAFVGVGLIFTYFVVMLWAIAYRIKKADHMQH